jgi:23S rRNA (adenine-N6)-dimethyltransferase
VGRGALVLDLGAGDGAITHHLVDAGARVIAFELHPDRCAALRTRFHGCSVKVVRADVADLRLPRRGFHVVANPPFAVVSAVLDRLTHRHSPMVRADLVVPVSVARRWGDELTHATWRVDVVARLPRSAFEPRPTIDCCVIAISRRAGTRGGR